MRANPHTRFTANEGTLSSRAFIVLTLIFLGLACAIARAQTREDFERVSYDYGQRDVAAAESFLHGGPAWFVDFLNTEHFSFFGHTGFRRTLSPTWIETDSVVIGGPGIDDPAAGARYTPFDLTLISGNYASGSFDTSKAVETTAAAAGTINYYWRDAQGNGRWDWGGAQWYIDGGGSVGAPVSDGGAILFFQGSGSQTTYINSGFTNGYFLLNSIFLDSNSSGRTYSINTENSGLGVGLFSKIETQTGSGAVTFNCGVKLMAGAEINAVGNVITLNDLVMNGQTLNSYGGNNLNITGVISGPGTYNIKNGGITVTYSGSSANTFTGGTTVENSSTLVLNKSANTAAIAGALTINSGATVRTDAVNQLNNQFVTANGTLSLNGNSQSTALAGSGTVSLNGTSGSGTLTINNTGNDTFSGTITDNARTDGAVIKTGVGTQILTGANSYDGTTTISQGVLQLGNATTTGTLSISSAIVDNANLTINHTNAVVQGTDFSGVAVSGTGSLTQAGTGTLTLNVANTYQGGTNINAGTLVAGAANALGTVGTIRFGGGTLQYSGNATDYSGRIANSGSAIAIDTNSQSVTFASAMGNTNTAGLTKIGLGTLSLNAANTYGGNTAIQNGTLQLGVNNGLPTGTILTLGNGTTNTAGVLDLNGKTQQLAGLLSIGSGINLVQATTGTAGALTLNIASGTNTYGGLLGQSITNRSFSVTKDGAGTLILTNSSSTFDRGLTLNAGTVSAQNFGPLGSPSAASTNAITFGGGTLQLTNSGSTQTTSSRVITLNSGGGTIDASNATTTVSGAVTLGGPIGGVGGLTKTGTGMLILSGTNDYAGSTLVSAGVLNLQNSSALGTSAGGTSVSAGAQLQLQGGISIGAEALSLTGNTSSPYNGTDLTGALRNFSGTNTFGGAITLASQAAIGADTSSSLLLTSTINNGGFRLIMLGAGDISVSNSISGAGDLLKQDAGTLTLIGNNSFGTGGTSAVFIDKGTIQVGTGGTVGTTNGTSTGWINMSASVAGRNGDTFLYARDAGLTIANPIDSRYYTTDVPGTQTVGGLNTSGTTTFSGNIALHDNITLTSATGGTTIFSGSIQNGSLNGANNQTTGQALVGSVGGGITKIGGGTVVLSGSNSYAGSTAINVGMLEAMKAGSLSGYNTAGKVSVASGATLAVAVGGAGQWVSSEIDSLRTNATFTSGAFLGFDTAGSNFTYGSDMTQTFGLKKLGANTLILTGTNSYSGGTTISAGTLQLGNNTTTGSIAGNVTNNGTLAFKRSDNTTFGGVISGSGAVTQDGSGTMSLTGANSYTGGTVINAGTLLANATVGATSATGTGTVTVNSGGTLGGSNGTLGAVTVNNGGSLTPGTAGTTTTYQTGALTLSSGSFFNVDLNGSAVGAYDQLIVTNGALAIGGSTLNLSLGTTFTSSDIGSKFYILVNNGGNALSGTFSNGTTVVSGNYLFTINYNDSVSGFGANDSMANDVSLTLTSVPEPSSWAAAGLAAAVVGYRLSVVRRRQRLAERQG